MIFSGQYNQKMRIHVLFKMWHGTFSRTGYIPGHKINLSKYKSIEIISSVWPQWHKTRNQSQAENEMRKKDYVETKQHATKKSQWVNEKIKEEIEKYLETNDNENATIENLLDIAKAILRSS